MDRLSRRLRMSGRHRFTASAKHVYKHIAVKPMTPVLGAEISGVDLTSPLPPDVFSEVQHAFHAHSVIFFRGQPMRPEQHLDFARLWGNLHVHPAAPFSHGNPELMMIHTDHESHRNNGETWHSDVSADIEPPMGSILHLHKTPTVGGDTCWSSMYAAYAALSEPLKQLLDPLTAIHEAHYDGWYEVAAQRQAQ